MALMTGRLARVYWDASNGDIELANGQNWSVDLTHDVHEVTAMAGYAASYWRTYNTGFQSWSATVESLQDTSGTEIAIGGNDGMGDDNACKLELYFLNDATNTTYRALYGTAICSGISTSHDKESIATTTWNFQGNGQLLWYTHESNEPTY